MVDLSKENLHPGNIQESRENQISICDCDVFNKSFHDSLWNHLFYFFLQFILIPHQPSTTAATNHSNEDPRTLGDIHSKQFTAVNASNRDREKQKQEKIIVVTILYPTIHDLKLKIQLILIYWKLKCVSER